MSFSLNDIFEKIAAEEQDYTGGVPGTGNPSVFAASAAGKQPQVKGSAASDVVPVQTPEGINKLTTTAAENSALKQVSKVLNTQLADKSPTAGLPAGQSLSAANPPVDTGKLVVISASGIMRPKVERQGGAGALIGSSTKKTASLNGKDAVIDSLQNELASYKRREEATKIAELMEAKHMHPDKTKDAKIAELVNGDLDFDVVKEAIKLASSPSSIGFELDDSSGNGDWGNAADRFLSGIRNI